MIWVTVFYVLFLIALIVFADMGKLNFLLWLMNSFRSGDKITHFVLIGILSFLVTRTAMQLFSRQDPKRVSVIVSITLCIIFTVEEISQFFIPNRRASFTDLAASFAGILIFALLAYQTRKKMEVTLVAETAD